MAITIEKNVPLPPISMEGRGRPAIYPLHDMEIGDSFALPLDGVPDGKNPNGKPRCDRVTRKVFNAANAAGKRFGRKYVTRTIKDEGVVRCWRVA